ncbi:unnamed protein product, partial [Rotaria sordida]
MKIKFARILHYVHLTYQYVFVTFRCVKRINHIDNKLTQIDHDAIVATLSSAIYTQITQLDEYYPYAQELKLLYQRVNDIKSTIIYHSNFENYSSST